MRFIFSFLFLFSTTIFSEISYADDQGNLIIMPHKPTYILPVNYNERIQDYSLYQDDDGNSSADLKEIKYQISFKTPLFQYIGDSPISAYVAYTQVSFWQAYNTDLSSPFRETNYEPEFFLEWEGNQNPTDEWSLKKLTVGLVHQSNGQTEPTSKSWNRIEANLAFGYGKFEITLNPWNRFAEKEEEDDNPDLLDYYGHGQIILAYENSGHVWSLVSRNNIESNFTKGSVQVAWSFPIFGSVKGYIQGFSGYGNSMVEYNLYTKTVGVGFIISDFL